MMPDTVRRFTQYHLHKAISCPVKFFYAKHGKTYPTRSKRDLFSRHNRRMRKKLELLTRLKYQLGKPITTKDYSQAALETSSLLNKSDTVTIYNGLLHYDIYQARVPLLRKEDGIIKLVMTRLKGAKPHRIQKQHIANYARSRWRKYLIDLTYLKWIAKRQYADYKISCLLMLPNMTSVNQIGDLYQRLDPKFFDDSSEMKQLAAQLSVANDLVLGVYLTTPVDELLAGEPLPDKTDTHFASGNFNILLKKATEIWRKDVKPPSPIGKHCTACEYWVSEKKLSQGQKSGFKKCWKPFMKTNCSPDFSNHHILSLTGHGREQLLANETFTLKQVDVNHLNTNIATVNHNTGSISQADRQYFQVQKSKNKLQHDELIKKKLFDELKKWEYPLHFIDFEAATLPIPIRKGGRAYETLVFQFSCHTLHKNGDLHHNQWLNTEPGKYPNADMVRNFLKIQGIESGTYIQYSPFEKNAFRKIRRQLNKLDLTDKDQLLDDIHKIISRPDSHKSHGPYFADLYRLIRTYYFNKYMDGNLGMKSALHAVLNVSPVLKSIYEKPYHGSNYADKTWWQREGKSSSNNARNPYDLIQNGLNDGSEAFAVYGLLQESHTTPQKREQLQTLLKKYCELDTLGLVMIYQHLKHKMETA